MKEGAGLFLSEKVNFFFELPIWVGSSLMSLGHLAAQGEGVNDFRVWNERHGLFNVLKSVRICGQGSLYFGAWSVGSGCLECTLVLVHSKQSLQY